MKPDFALQNADDVLQISDEVSVLTKGMSMRPLFREHRDIAVISRLQRAPRVNDVLLYRKQGCKALVLHRLIRIKKDGSYVIRGDNNCFTEYDVTDGDIVGVLKEFYRDGKYQSCENNPKYSLYSFYIRHSYPLRFLWKKTVLRVLIAVKHRLFPKKSV